MGEVTAFYLSKIAAIRSSAPSTSTLEPRNPDVSTAINKFIPTWRAAGVPPTSNDLNVAILVATQT